MSSRNNFEQALSRLNSIRANPYEEGAVDYMRHALSSPSNLLAATAATIIGEWEMDGFTAELVAAFNRFLNDPVRNDPTCAAKIAIVETLNRSAFIDADLFTRGLRHNQMEPVYGGREDTAAGLRAACALGLARSDPPEVLLELATLLADSEADARIGAVRAISMASRPGSAPLLWYKANVGDSEPSVMYECFTALLLLAPESALPFVADRLHGEQEVLAETAALALGASRQPAALPLLISAWDDSAEVVFRRALLTAIATHGSEEGFTFLLGLLATAPAHDARSALSALSLFRDDERRRRKVDRVLRKRADLDGSA